MDTNIDNKKTENDEKHGGGSHIFLFMGGALVLLILLKFLIDKFVN